MTRRKLIFYNDLSQSWIISEEFTGGGWDGFMEAMDEVDGLVGFLDALSKIWKSNRVASPNGEQLPGTRLFFAHDAQDLRDKLGDVDEVWEVRRGGPGATLMPMLDGTPILDRGNFRYKTAKPGDLVTQEVVDGAMNCMPPVSMSTRCAQMGEPYSTMMDDRTGRYRQTYATFRKVAGQWPNGIWEYCGHCFAGETEERGERPCFATPEGGT